jgi:hypothetical protein
MPSIISTYYLALSAGNVAFVTFAWSKFAAPLAAPPRKQQQGRYLATTMKKVKAPLSKEKQAIADAL